jgi:hypothetical protein
MFPSRSQAHAGARALGWFSIALGAAQLLAPRRLARATGMPDHMPVMRAVGLRQITTGVALLSSARPDTWMWGRVAGDLLDAALLARTLRSNGSAAPRAALVAVGLLAVADLALARRLSRPPAVARVDYKARSGFPLPSEEMRGLARSDFAPPADMRVPAALRPWTEGARTAASPMRDAER